MCLVVFAWQVHPRHRLILAGNRDEAHARPTRDAGWWPENESILAGRDLRSGGSWLAISRSGRFATVTNFYEGERRDADLESRGRLVIDFAAGSKSAVEFESAIEYLRYAAFSLLTCDGESLRYTSNRDELRSELAPGIYGLSNASLDTPWSKVRRSKSALRSLIDRDGVSEAELMRILSDRNPAAATDTHATELPFEVARTLSAPFIVSPDYGTRSSTTLLWGEDGRIEFCERRFDAAGRATGESRFRFDAE